jgi:hypothetical protein
VRVSLPAAGVRCLVLGRAVERLGFGRLIRYRPPGLAMRSSLVTIALVSGALLARIAVAQPKDVPPAIAPSTCPTLNFDAGKLVLPARVDFVVTVGVDGRMTAIDAISPEPLPELWSALVEQFKTCRFEHALINGQAAPGKARFIRALNPPSGRARIRESPILKPAPQPLPTTPSSPNA